MTLYDDAESQVISQSQLELIERMREGDKVAFDELWANGCHEWVYSRAFEQIGNYHDAQDRTQEIGIKVWLARAQLHSSEKFFGWVKQIIDNHIKNFKRDEKQQPSVPITDGELEIDKKSLKDYEDNYTDKKNREERNDKLDEWKEGLPEYRRMVIDLASNGYEDEEIARILNKRKTAISTEKSRGVKQLRDLAAHNKTLRSFLLLPPLRRIMRPIANSLRNSAPASKPLLSPVGSSTLLAIVLVVPMMFIGMIRQNSTSQPPDSFVVPGVEMLSNEHKKPSLKPQQANWAGEESEMQENDSVPIEKPSLNLSQVNRSEDNLAQKTAADLQLEQKNNNGVSLSTKGEELSTKAAADITYTGSEDLVFYRDALYMVTDDGVGRSADGNSWVLASDGLIADGRVQKIALDGLFVMVTAKLTISGGKLHAIVCESNTPPTFRIYYLAADGTSWLPVHMNMPSFDDRIDSINRLEVSGENFYVITRLKIYRWRIGEDLWKDLGLRVWHRGGFDVSGDTIYFQRYDGKIIRSPDEGETWTEVSSLPKSKVEVTPKRDSPEFRYDLQTDSFLSKVDLHFIDKTIYAGTRYDGVFVLDGKIWRSITDGLPDYRIKIWLVSDEALYGTNFAGLFRLKHGSDSWERIAPIQHTVRSLAFDGATTFYIGTSEAGIVRLSLDE